MGGVVAPAIRSPPRRAPACCARAATRSTRRSARYSSRAPASRCSPGSAPAATCSSSRPGPASRCCSTSSSRRPAAAPTPIARADLVPVERLLRRRGADLQRRRGVGRRLRRARGPARPRPRASGRFRWPSWRPAAAATRPPRASRSTPSRPTWSRSSRGSSPRRPEIAAIYAPDGRLAARAATRFASPELADALERLGARGRGRRSTAGEVAEAVAAWLEPRGGMLTCADLAAYEVVAREPVRGRLPRSRRADQPAAVGRRHRSSPTRSRCWTASPAPPASDAARRRDGGRAGRAHAGVPRGPRDAGLRRSASSPRAWARPPTSRCSTPTAGRAR